MSHEIMLIMGRKDLTNCFLVNVVAFYKERTLDRKAGNFSFQ